MRRPPCGGSVLSHRTITSKELRSAGWSADPKPAYRCYTHPSGWKIQHCGHPTALWPYLIFDPSGKPILTGAAFGNPATYGTAWPTVSSAVDYVSTQLV